MGMIKNKSAETTAPAPAVSAPVVSAPAEVKTAANGTAAAISRLKSAVKSKVIESTQERQSAPRASDDSRGKTRCVAFNAALMSPALAGVKFESVKQYLGICKEAADYAVAYAFDELPDEQPK